MYVCMYVCMHGGMDAWKPSFTVYVDIIYLYGKNHNLHELLYFKVM